MNAGTHAGTRGARVQNDDKGHMPQGHTHPPQNKAKTSSSKYFRFFVNSLGLNWDDRLHRSRGMKLTCSLHWGVESATRSWIRTAIILWLNYIERKQLLCINWFFNDAQDFELSSKGHMHNFLFTLHTFHHQRFSTLILHKTAQRRLETTNFTVLSCAGCHLCICLFPTTNEEEMCISWRQDRGSIRHIHNSNYVQNRADHADTHICQNTVS